MANIKSQKKRILVSAKQHERNKSVMSAVRTSMRKSLAAIDSGNKDEAQTQVQATVKALDKAAQKGVIHPNNAANKKARLVKKLNNTPAS